MRHPHLPHFKDVKLQMFNIPKMICNHMLGPNHHIRHRIVVGILVMFVGVNIARIGTELYILSIIYDLTGYAIHAVGAIPIIEGVVGAKAV